MRNDHYTQISPDLLKKAKGNAWSLENIEAHGVSRNAIKYIGSSVGEQMDNGTGRRVTDYYKDAAGGFWFQDRVLQRDGTIVSMNVHLFGKEKKTSYRRYKRRKY